MNLNQLSDNKGARKNRTRVGRGIGSGKGKTCGRGMKGQKSRSGGSIRPGFEGGQNPLYQRLPMRGFNNKNFTTNYSIINLGDLQKMIDEGSVSDKDTITLDVLMAAGLTKKAGKDGLKILGSGDLKAKLTIEAAAASASAVEKVKKAGGTLTLPEKKEPVKKLPKKNKA